MITSFADKATRDVFHGDDTKQARRLPKVLWPLIRRKLDMLNAANRLEDLRSPPGNRLEKLRNGSYSIRVNDQYRIVFRFQEGNASQVLCADYH